MSEHDSHEDSAISALYRRLSHGAPSPHLDERVMATARRHAVLRSHRWWLPLSTAAVVVLAVSLVLRHKQAPDELQEQLARYEASPAASLPAPAAPAELPPEVPRKEARSLDKPERTLKSQVAEAPVVQAEKKAEPLPQPVESAKEKPAAPAMAPTDDVAETRLADTARFAAAPQAAAGARAKSEEVAEAPEPWLKRIEALRVKGEAEAAKRELVAFRKVYPAWPLPKELQALLPEAK